MLSYNIIARACSHSAAFVIVLWFMLPSFSCMCVVFIFA